MATFLAVYARLSEGNGPSECEAAVRQIVQETQMSCELRAHPGRGCSPWRLLRNRGAGQIAGLEHAGATIA